MQNQSKSKFVLNNFIKAPSVPGYLLRFKFMYVIATIQSVKFFIILINTQPFFVDITGFNDTITVHSHLKEIKLVEIIASDFKS